MSTGAAAVIDVPADTSTEIALVDLSSIAYPIYLTSTAQPDPDYASQQIVARVRQLTAAHPKAAICCDKGQSFRAQIDPTYKANRPPAEAALHHQIGLAKERLEADGYPVWAIPGFEADDLIATATRHALACEGVSVLILSADKDLLQLVGPRVRAQSLRDGSIVDEAAVVAKFGVRPDQMRDYLCLVGDASDNVKGAKGIGPKTAAKLLAQFGTLDAVLNARHLTGVQDVSLSPSIASSLEEFAPRAADVRALISLNVDAEIPFADLDNDRAVKDLPPMEGDVGDTLIGEVVAVVDAPASAPRAERAVPAGQPTVQNGAASGPSPALSPAPIEWSMQLEPRSMGEAERLATTLHASRLFAAYGTPHAVLSTILAGRELGLPAMASLRAFHIIDGKPSMSAGMIQAHVLKSGKAKYFRCTERTAERATFETQRGDDPPVSLSFTLAEGRAAWPKDEAAWLKSGWGRNPADMNVARAGSKLARLVYPDVVAGLYAPEEFD